MINQFSNFFLLAEKIFAIVGTGIYFVFSIVIVKQVSTMTKNVQDKFNGILVAFSWIHLVFAIFLVLLAFFV